MKPFIYKVKGTDVYVWRSAPPGWGGNIELTSDRSKATEWRSRKNEFTERFSWYDNGLNDMSIYKTDIAGRKMLDDAGYKNDGEKWHLVMHYIFCLDDFERVEVEEKEMSPVTVTGPYVIKLKGCNIYLRPSTDRENTFTMIKSEAKVYNNPKTDIIGKMERGMTVIGTATPHEKPMKDAWVKLSGARGLAVRNEFLTNPVAMEIAKQVTFCGRGVCSLYQELIDAIGWRCSAEFPGEFFEREDV